MSFSIRISTISNSSPALEPLILNPTINELVYTYENRLKLQKKRPPKLFFPLSHQSHLMAQTFMLNIYEINCICETYLIIWSHNSNKDNISIHQLSSCVLSLSEEFLSHCFSSNEISYDAYFQFVCIFLFLTPKQIISLVLSWLNIRSNVMIKKSQTSQIISLFNYVYSQSELDEFYFNNQMDCLDCNEPVYPIKAFTEFLTSSISLQSVFFSVRMNLIDNVLSPKIYSNIVKRQMYYTEDPQRILQPRSEPFCQYLQRVLFTHEPPPYHYDFILQKPNEQSKDALVYCLRQGRGYGYRQPSSCGKRTLNSSPKPSISSPKTSLAYPVRYQEKNKISPIL